VVRGGQRPPVRALVVAGGQQVLGRFCGRGQFGEPAVQVGAGGRVEQAGRRLRQVRRHGQQRTVRGGGQPGGDQVGGTGAEQGGRGAATEQAERGQGGAGRAGQVGQRRGDRVRHLVNLCGGGAAAGRGVPGERGHRQRVAAGAAGHCRQRVVAQLRGTAAGQVRGGGAA
jgi:hypothetical protein